MQNTVAVMEERRPKSKRLSRKTEREEGRGVILVNVRSCVTEIICRSDMRETEIQKDGAKKVTQDRQKRQRRGTGRKKERKRRERRDGINV